MNKREKNVTGTTFGSTDSHGLLSITGALNWIVIAFDGGLHRIVCRALGRLRVTVMLQRLIVRRGDRRIKRTRDGTDIVKTGAQLVARYHHAVCNTHRGYARRLSLKVQITHLMGPRNIRDCYLKISYNLRN